MKKNKKPIYEETQHPSIEQSYDELSQEGFAVWIRMMVMTPDELCLGKLAIGKKCGYSVGRFYKIMKELHNKDYVRYNKPPRLGMPHEVILHKRAMISGRNNFVRLSGSPSVSNIRDVLSGIIEDNEQSNMKVIANSHNKKHIKPKRPLVDSNNESSMEETPFESKSESRKGVTNVPSREELISKGRRKHVIKTSKTVGVVRKENVKSPPPITPSPNNKTPNNNKNNKTNRISSFASQNEDYSLNKSNYNKYRARGNENPTGERTSKKNETPLSVKLAEKALKIKQERKEKRKNKKTVKSWKIDYNLLETDYDKIDRKGDPSISFNPKSPRREKLIAILEASTKGKGVTKKMASERKKAKIRTEQKLGHEFSRIYTRYRNLVNIARNRESRFAMPPSSEKYCSKIAVQCIYNEITPRQLLEYWDENIKHFANKTFKHPYPTLTFLSGVYAAEQVAAAVFENTDGGKRKWKSGDFTKTDNSKTASHSFFDVRELDVELKEGLVEAGFEIGAGTKYNDRYLLTIQKTAISIAKGKHIFVTGVMKDMVNWAVENLYAYNGE
jgi:uncharacterized protein YndB with AHSA1/START domain